MRIYTEDVAMTPAIERTFRIVGKATAEFVLELAQIVDISHVTEGDGEFDYFVRVPVDQLPEAT